jgi:hypothetical protein
MSFDSIENTLGFDATDETPAATYITSDFPLRPMEDTHLLLHCGLPPHGDVLSLDNFNGIVEASDILASIHLNAPPFQLVTFQNTDGHGVFTSDTKINSLELRFTDQEGEAFDVMPEHYLTLRVEVYEWRDSGLFELYERVDQIKDLLDKMWLNEALKLTAN